METSVVERHFAFHAAVEGRASQADDDKRHAEVNGIAAVAAGIAANQLNRCPN
jgi:hypothetical protein